MTDKMLRGLVVDIFIVFLFIWMIGKLRLPSKGTILLMAIFIGTVLLSWFPSWVMTLPQLLSLTSP
jgi:prepilin signal peptidase PulO-like enzyme (type II secretory pathway)